MPNPWKKARFAAVSRFISGVRSKRTASPLVVEIGFPTSLADLVVKNRARLKKPSWKKNPSPKSDSTASPKSDFAAASVTSPTIAAASVTPPTIAADAVTSPSIDSAKSLAAEEIHCPVPVPVHLGFLLVAKVIVLVALVVIGKKKFVAGVTFSAFALLFLEILGLRAVDFLKPCYDTRMRLRFLVGGLRFRGRGGEPVSRTEEVEVDSLSGSWESERNCVESVVLDRPSEDSAEQSELASVEEAVTDQNAGSSGNSKGKKRWKKFIPKKFRKGAIGKNEKELNSCSSRGRVSDCNREEGVKMSKGQEEEERNDVERNDSFRESGEVSHFTTQDDRGNVKETRLWSSRQLVFFVVVLLGLTGGKVVALVLTAVWYLLVKLVDLSWRKCMVRRVD